MTKSHPQFEKPFSDDVQRSSAKDPVPCDEDDHAVTSGCGHHKDFDGYLPGCFRRPRSTFSTHLKMLWTRHRLWALPALFSLVIVLLTWPVESSSLASRADPPRQSTGLTDAVQWDNYTLFINDQRILL